MIDQLSVIVSLVVENALNIGERSQGEFRPKIACMSSMYNVDGYIGIV